MSRLKEYYNKEVLPKIKEEFGYTNNLEAARIEKVVINAGVGRALQDAKALDRVIEELARITGQRPKRNRAKKSIAGFKIREGMDIGASVTLRGEKMYEFIDRLVNVSLPRVRDFRGISSSAFDKKGNYSLGIKEHTVFPEISVDEVGSAFSFQINIITTAKTDEEAKSLLKNLGFPFKNIS